MLMAQGPVWGQRPWPPNAGQPPYPELPENFAGSGRYIVRDIDADVPFTWHGKDGDWQMIAGGKDEKIHFTNLYYKGYLYTYTYKWPDLPPALLPPKEPCKPIDPPFAFDVPRYVGAEVLHFGLQNLYDPALDEWIVMDSFDKNRLGEINLPGVCDPPPVKP